MVKILKQSIWVTLLSAVIAISVNLVSPRGIDFFEDWPTIIYDDTNVELPCLTKDNGEPLDAGEPKCIRYSDAIRMYQSDTILFIDARSVEDYELGHIKGAFNIPYDYIEEEYWDDMPDILNQYKGFVTYCSGSDCEASLGLGRELKYNGFENVYVFWGGWRVWEHNKGEVTEGSERGN